MHSNSQVLQHVVSTVFLGVGAPLDVSLQRGYNAGMMEIIRLKYDNGVLSVRLPRWWLEREGLGRRDYVVISPGPKGRLTIGTVQQEVPRGLKARSSEPGKDS